MYVVPSYATCASCVAVVPVLAFSEIEGAPVLSGGEIILLTVFVMYSCRVVSKSSNYVTGFSNIAVTITGMAVDLQRRCLSLANGTGGLSGPALKPVALRMVHQVVNSVSIPVIGIGGIMNAEDALEFLLVGATAVQVGTANLVNPGAMAEIIAGIENFMTQQGIEDVNTWIGSLR